MILKIGDNYPANLIKPEIKVIHYLEELVGFKEVWNKIIKDNKNTNPFLEFDWIENWWNFFGSGHRLFVLVLQVKDTIVGFCPFMIIKRRFFQELTFIGYPEASFMDFILTLEYRVHGIKAALDYIKNIKDNYIIHLHGLYAESITNKILEEYFTNNKIKFFIRSFEVPYIRINDDFSSYLQERSKFSSMKTSIRSKKKLEGAGNVVYKQLNSSEFDVIYQLHEMRWKRKYDTSNFSNKKHREFFRVIANNMSFKVHVYGLMLGNRLIAFTYGFLLNGTYYFYRISHDNDFSVFGPGKIILMKLLEDCFQNNIHIFDFGLGCARYKYEWTNDKKIIHEFTAQLDSRYSRIFYYKYLIRKIVIENLKKFKYYDLLKVGLMGTIHCLFKGVYYRDIIHALNNFKKEVLKSKIQYILKKIVKNLYIDKDYMIYEKTIDNSGHNAMIKDRSCTSASQEANKDLLDIESNSKTDNIVNEAYLNDLEFLCELMKEKPAQIIKRFYQKQRCFILVSDNKTKECLWINYTNIEIPDINYQDKLSENISYIDLTKVDAGEASMNSLLQTINCFINTSYDKKCTKCYLGIITKPETLNNHMISFGFRPVKHINYKKILFKSYLKIIEHVY